MKRYLFFWSVLSAIPALAAANDVPLSKLPPALRAQFTAKLDACGASSDEIAPLGARRIPYAPGEPPIYQVRIDATSCGAGPMAPMAEFLEASPRSGGVYEIEDVLGTSYMTDAKGSWVRVTPHCNGPDSTRAFRWDPVRRLDHAVTACMLSGGAIKWAQAHGYR